MIDWGGFFLYDAIVFGLVLGAIRVIWWVCIGRTVMERGSIYPSWRYHTTEAPVLCLDAAQDAALGHDWSDEDIRVFPQAGDVAAETSIAEDAPTAEAPKKRGRKPKA